MHDRDHRTVTAPMLIAIGLIAAFCTPVWAEPLRFNLGVSNIAKPSVLIRTYRPIIQAIETELASALSSDVDVRMRISNTPEDLVAALQAGTLDFASLPFTENSVLPLLDADLHAVVIDNDNNVLWLTNTATDSLKYQALADTLQVLSAQRHLNGQSISELARNNVQRSFNFEPDHVAADVAAALLSAQAFDSHEPVLNAALPDIASDASVTSDGLTESGATQITIRIEIPNTVLQQIQNAEQASELDVNVTLSPRPDSN